jgi:hypothetical protein
MIAVGTRIIEREGLRFAKTALLAIDGRVAAEFDQPGLVRMQ